MRIQISTYPAERLYDGDVDPTLSITEIIKLVAPKEFDTEGRVLIIDKNQNFHRIPVDDPVNRYFDGRQGEIYRIVDSSVRYRIVIPPIPASKEKGKTKEKRVSDSVYASAYENILTMLSDRKCNQDTLAQFSLPKQKIIQLYRTGSLDSLSIPGMDSTVQLINGRKRAVYVFFLGPHEDVLTSRRGTELKGLLLNWMNEVITHHAKVTGEQMTLIDRDMLITGSSDEVVAFAKRFELIIIYNNPTEKAEIAAGIEPKFYQAFPVQNLAFVVTNHVDQPNFTLLDGNTDREEIRNMYAQNGRILEGDKSLNSYSLRDGIRLMLI